MKSNHFLRAILLMILLVSFFPAGSVSALVSNVAPPANMFQWPWEQGKSWVAVDGFDNGTRRLPNSPHNYLNGGAVDFAPHKNTWVGEDTSNYWVTAAAAGTVVEISNCYLKINHGNGWITDYEFLANIQVQLGQAVYRNQRLAVIADGLRQKFCPPALDPDTPHLHFSLRPDMRGATFAGWKINYSAFLNRTTFTKDGITAGLYQPLSNDPTLQIVLRDPITWDTVYIGSVDTYLYERWPFVLDETTTFTITATPTTDGLVPLVLLLDANGDEITRGVGTLTSTQPAGNYFVQIQPQSGSGFYDLLLKRNAQPVPNGPYVSTEVTPVNINVGDNAVASVSLNNVPAEGYTSAEFTCTYDAGLVEVGNIFVTDLFGADSATAIHGPANGSFIVAIAGSNDNRATTSGVAFTFNVTGLQAGQTSIDCEARTSQGDNVLTQIPSIAANLTILGNTPPPTTTPVPTESPTATFTSTPEISPTPTFTTTPSPTSNWLTFINSTYSFQFQYPPDAQIAAGGTDNFTRIDLPFMPGTNLTQKYMEMVVAENPTVCQSPLATSSILETSETVVINGISFLKQTGQDGSAGHINKWTAYTTQQGNACVSLDFVLRATNPGVYTTPPPLYDEAAESAVFGQIVSTYAWLNVPTVTPTSTSTPVESPTPTPLPNGVLGGQVLASKPVTVSLYALDNSLITSVSTNADGSFSLTAPTGTYNLLATANGFLSAQGSIILSGSNTQPTITLLAGDIDNNNVVDQFDAMTIGMSYNTAVPDAADLNNDGIINVLDLELLALNYRKTGPIIWQ